MLTERKIVFSCMRYIQGIFRYQLQLSSLYDKITANNPVRFIDAFVNVIDLEKLGFLPRFLKHEERPSFVTVVFLKLYLTVISTDIYIELNPSFCESPYT
jgi:hypothetical protein